MATTAAVQSGCSLANVPIASTASLAFWNALAVAPVRRVLPSLRRFSMLWKIALARDEYQVFQKWYKGGRYR